LFTLFNYVFLL
jgi:hypothetical protein